MVPSTWTTWSALPSGVMIWTGEPDPAGKCRARTSWPVTESTVVRNRSDCVTPLASKVGTNAAQAASRTNVMIQVRRAWAPIIPATRPQMPRRPMESSACAWSTWGMPGQKIRRPMSSRTAGRKVSDAMNAPAMPNAPTGPSPFVLPSSDSCRQSNPRITVAALAAIGSTAARQAALIAAHVDSLSCSSSLYLATRRRA